jgi:O-antigen/teichoic acid export membrane protein
MGSKISDQESSKPPATGTTRAGPVGKKLAVNSIVGIVTQMINLVSRIAITPFVLSYISLKEYGLWTICFVILSYAGLSAFGVNNAYVKYVAEYQANREFHKINELLSTGIIVMSSLCVALYTALVAGVPFFLHKFGVEPQLQSLATTLILGTALAFLIEIGLGGFKGLLEGLQEIALVSYVYLLMGIIEVILIFVFLPLGFGIQGMLYAYIVKTVLLVVILACFAFKKIKGLTVRFALIRREALHSLFVFGGKIQVMGLMSIFIETFDRVVTSSLLGLAATGLIEIGRKFPNTARGFSGPAFAPFIPAASYLGGWWEESQWPTFSEKIQKYGRLLVISIIVCLAGILLLSFGGTKELALFSIIISPLMVTGAIAVLLLGLWLIGWLRHYKNINEYFVGDDVKGIFLKGSRHINLVNFIVFTFLIVTADRLIFAWLGPGYETAKTIMVVVAISNLIHQGTGPGTSIFRGVNRSGREFEYTIIQFVLVLGWIPAMTALLGVVGAAVGFSLSAIVASGYFYWRSFKAFRIPLLEALRVMVLPGLAPILAGVAMRMGLLLLPSVSRWQTIIVLGVTLICYLVLTFVLLKQWFLTPEEWAVVNRLWEKISIKACIWRPSVDRR